MLKTPVSLLLRCLLDGEAYVGISLHPDHGSEPEALIHAADQAMYRAKEDDNGFVAVADTPP